MASTKTKKLSLAQRAKKDPKLLARVLANPGLRSKLPSSMLPADLRAKREMNVRLSQPIVPGSSTTERDLSRAAQASADVQYGGLEQTQNRNLLSEQARARDVGGTGGFYDQYLSQLAAHQAAVNANAQAAAQAGLTAQNQVTGLAQADLSQLQGGANAAAAQRGMGPAGDVSGMANQATAVRQALVGNFVNQQAQNNAATTSRASNLANVVGPTQKLSAQVQGQGRVRLAEGDIAQTAKERGAATAKYKQETRADEAKNVLAEQVATGKSAAELARIKLESARVTETGRHNVAQEEAAATKAADASQAAADKAAAKGHEPNKWGVPADQWARWSTSHRQRIIDAKGGGGSGKPGKGPDWVTQSESGTAMTQLTGLKSAAQKAKAGEAFIEGHKPQPRMSRAAAEKKILGFAPIASKLKHPVLVRAALDAIYDGHISAYTVKGLIAAGYKPSEVARTLGVMTSGEFKRTRSKRLTTGNTRAYGNSGNLGQTGHK